MSEFYNPFHFVPVAKPTLELMPKSDLFQRPTERATHQHVTHDRYVPQSLDAEKQSQQVYSGRIACRLKTVTPTVLGSDRTEASDEEPAKVFPFEVPALRDGKLVLEPAIPESSLRGMLSSLYEALTNSSMRVLNDTALSVRANAMAGPGQPSEALQAVGMIHEREGKRYLLPLTFPSLRGGVVPKEFQAFEPFAQLRVYLDRQDGRDSNTADSKDSDKVYFLKGTLPRPANHQFANTAAMKDRGGFIGWGSSEPLITYAEWLKKPSEERKQYMPGLLRNLRGRSASELQGQRPSDANGNRDLPNNVRHEWFIPLDAQVYEPAINEFIFEDNNLPLLDAEVAALEFEAVAKARTAAEIKLPYELRGSLRNAKTKNKRNHVSHEIQLRTRDLVCFSFAGPSASVVSISSIWRRPTGTVHGWFEKLGADLLPLNSRRENLTLAKQTFGAVEQDRSKNKTNRAKGLAGRVRFSTGRLLRSATGGSEYLSAGVLPILGSPKPPSPRLYFRRSNGGGVGKQDLSRAVGGDIVPQGRKQYLIHANLIAQDERIRSWVTLDDTDHPKQKAAVTPLRPGREFEFEIRFDNLNRVELGMLMLALKPNHTFRHRLGMAKPLGLGVVELIPVTAELVDRRQRYAADGLGDVRHHQVWRYDDPSAQSEWSKVVAEARKRLESSPALAVVELLGNPESARNHPVHYPRLADGRLPQRQNKPDIERELFKWHTENEQSRSPQSLAPIPTGPQAQLPTLTN